MRQKTTKNKAIAFTFRPFSADFSIFENEVKKQEKSKAINSLYFSSIFSNFYHFS
jgi:hypothetical protein